MAGEIHMPGRPTPVGTEAFEVQWCFYMPTADKENQGKEPKFAERIFATCKEAQRKAERLIRAHRAVGRVAIMPVVLTDPFNTQDARFYQWEPIADADPWYCG